MKLRQPFYKLPLRFDIARLGEEIRALPEDAWRPHPSGYEGNTALLLVSANGSQNDETRGAMRPTPFLEQCPYMQQVMAAFETVIGRSRLMRLEAESEVHPHTDIAYYWRTRTRIHIPVITDPSVIFHCEDNQVHMAAGECWTFDNWRTHKVENPSNITRIHMVIDTVGTPAFWRMLRDVEQGEAVDKLIGYDPTAPAPSLVFENFESAPVMSPGELDRNCEALVEDLRARSDNDQELVDDVAESLEEIRHAWRSVWVAYGMDRGAWPQYQAIVDDAVKLAQHLPQTFRVASNGMTAASIINSDFASALDRKAVPMQAANTNAPARRAAAAGGGGGGLGIRLPQGGQGAGGGRARGAGGGQQRAGGGQGRRQPAAAGAGQQRAGAGQGQRGPAIMVNFDRPVFIVAAPRSGSTLLFETLANNRDFWTVGDESHQQIEGIPDLHPKARQFESNRLTHLDASPKIIDALRRSFARALRSADGTLLRDLGGQQRGTAKIRFLEKTPKNALRIPFLRAVFPEARFIFLHRAPRENISSLLDSWRSGRYVTYRGLPGWQGEQEWSHLLIPGWREMVGRDLPDVVAEQWMVTNQTILDDLEKVPETHWCSIKYEEFLAQPAKELRRLCDFAEVPFGQRLERVAKQPLKPSKYTLTAPDPDKWKKNEAEVMAVLDRTKKVTKRLGALKR